MSKRSQTDVNSSVSAKVPRVAEAARREDTIIRPNDIWVDDDGIDSDNDVIAEFEGDRYPPVATQPNENVIEPETRTETPAKTDDATKSESQGEPESSCGETESSEDALWLGDDVNISNISDSDEDGTSNMSHSSESTNYASIGRFRSSYRRLDQTPTQDRHDSDESTIPDDDSNDNPFSPLVSPCDSDDDDEEEEEEEKVEKTTKPRISKHLRIQGNKLVAHLRNFEKIEWSSEMCKVLPFKLRNLAELGKYKFQKFATEFTEHSPITLFLMSAFIHKSALLEYNQTTLGNNGCLKVTVTEKMLALLICLLTKYRHDEFHYSHLLECERYFYRLDHPCKRIWECAKKEMRWMKEDGDSPFQRCCILYSESRSELLFDDMFSRYRELELDTKIFLICLTESEAAKNA